MIGADLNQRLPVAPLQRAINTGVWNKRDQSVPTSNRFTTFGTVTSVTDHADRLVIATPNQTSICGVLDNQPLPPSPYTIDFGGSMISDPTSSGSTLCGIVLSDGTKYKAIYAGFTDTSATAGNPKIIIDNWTSLTASTNLINRGAGIFMNNLFMRVQSDGTNWFYQYSHNGKDWHIFATEAVNTFVTATKFGIVVFAPTTSARPSKTVVQHWQMNQAFLGDDP